MKSFSALCAALLLISLLPACSHQSAPEQVILTPAYEPPVDPDDSVLVAAIEEFLSTTGAPAVSKYEFARFDLDADGLRDGMVLFKTPYGYWCDRNGCTMLVLKAGDGSFNLVNAIQPVRGPLFVSQTESNGWKDLMMRISGRWEDSKDVAIRYNGTHYPSNPASLPPSPVPAREQPVRFFMGM